MISLLAKLLLRTVRPGRTSRPYPLLFRWMALQEQINKEVAQALQEMKTGSVSSTATTPEGETPRSTPPGSPPSPAKGASGRTTTEPTTNRQEATAPTGRGQDSASTPGQKSSVALGSKMLSDLQQMIRDSSEKLSHGGRA